MAIQSHQKITDSRRTRFASVLDRRRADDSSSHSRPAQSYKSGFQNHAGYRATGE